jgi:hypothetical protein
MGVKGIEANLGKSNLSYSIVNAIGGKHLRAPRRPNKGRKYWLYWVGVLVGSLRYEYS